MQPIQPPSDVWHTSGWCAGPCSSLALHSVTPINHWPPEPAPHTWPASLDLWPLYIQAHPFTTTESSPHNSLYKNISAETLRRHGTHCCVSPSFSDTVLSYSYSYRPTCCRHTRLCSANHRAGYISNLACDWLSILRTRDRKRAQQRRLSTRLW